MLEVEPELEYSAKCYFCFMILPLNATSPLTFLFNSNKFRADLELYSEW